MKEFIQGVLLLLAGLLFLWLIGIIEPQPPAQSDWLIEVKDDRNSFYKGLKMNDGKTSCCSERDCEGADDWRATTDGKYQIKMYGVWVEPPQNVIQFKETPDSGAHACFSRPSTNAMPGGHVTSPPDPKYWHWHCVVIPMTLM